MAKVGMKKNTIKREVESKTHIHSKVANGIEYDVKDPIQRLIFTCGTMFGEPTYYEDKAEFNERLGTNEAAHNLIATMKECVSIAPEDFLIIMSWCRDALRMRTTPEVGFAIASQDERAKHLLPLYGENLITRADQIRTAFAAIRHLYHMQENDNLHKGSINKPTAKALAQAFKKFDEYQFLKWDGKPVSFKDVWNMIAQKVSEKDRISKPMRYYLTHGEVLDAEATPVFAARQNFNKETDLKKALKIAKAARVTWEVLLSKFGNADKDTKKSLWEHLIDNKMLPYMAMLRNLRNIEEAKVSENHINKVYEIIANTPADEHKQLPFRFYSARTNIKNQELESAVDIALDKSVINLPKLTGNSLVLVDLSGSMSCGVSGKSTVSCMEAAMLLASIFAKTQGRKTVIGAFASNFKTVGFSEADSVTNIMKKIAKSGVSGGTYAHLGVEWALNENKKFDRIVLLSDMCCYTQHGWDTQHLPVRFKQYQAKFPDTFFYSINLAGNTSGSQMDPNNKKVCLLSGYSENIFKLFSSFEDGVTESETGEKQIPTMEELRKIYGKNINVFN